MDRHFQPNGRSNRQRMLDGDQYFAEDPNLARESNHAANLTAAFNATGGDDVQIGPNVQLLTATHPLEPEPRRAKWEGSRPSRSATTSGWAAA